MTDKTNSECSERKPACTLEEARELIEALRAQYQGLSPAEQLEVRQALQEAAACSEDSKASPPTAWVWCAHISIVLARWADVACNAVNDPRLTNWSTRAA